MRASLMITSRGIDCCRQAIIPHISYHNILAELSYLFLYQFDWLQQVALYPSLVGSVGE